MFGPGSCWVGSEVKRGGSWSLAWQIASLGMEPRSVLSLRKVLRIDKVIKVESQLVMAVPVVAINRRLVKCAVHWLDLSINPGVLGFG